MEDCIRILVFFVFGLYVFDALIYAIIRDLSRDMEKVFTKFSQKKR